MGTDPLDISQPFLTNNTNAADDAFGTDHYKFSDTTSSRGFHNQVTTPNFLTSPAVLPNVHPTTTTNPIFYGFNQLNGAGVPTSALGMLQYSRGINNAVPCPVTLLQSTLAVIPLNNGATSNILDFSNVPVCYGMVYMTDMVANKGVSIWSFTWNGTNQFVIGKVASISVFYELTVSGNVLQVINNSGSPLTALRWSLQFFRMG